LDGEITQQALPAVTMSVVPYAVVSRYWLGLRRTSFAAFCSAYFGKVAGDPHHRYRSCEHCYRFFRDLKASGFEAQRQNAALQLGFYLASWGMYRGSTFLLQHAYTVHLGVVDCLAFPRFAPLWEREFGCEATVIAGAAKSIVRN
jgi:hypothetical protein